LKRGGLEIETAVVHSLLVYRINHDKNDIYKFKQKVLSNVEHIFFEIR